MRARGLVGKGGRAERRALGCEAPSTGSRPGEQGGHNPLGERGVGGLFCAKFQAYKMIVKCKAHAMQSGRF